MTAARMIFHAGRYMPASSAVMPISALTLRYGLSVFEGIRVYRQPAGSLRACRMEAHLRRLRKG